MAIWYIDPFAAINGSGTWASPWSLLSATRTGLASGDEVRIKGYSVASITSGVAYTATVSSVTSITITAGGALGADFAVNTIVWVPEWDAFFKVYTKATNTISVYQNPLPFSSSTEIGRTDLTVYKVTSLSLTAATMYLLGTSTNGLSNITVTDGWSTATTRVTDGSVKSLISTSVNGVGNIYACVSTETPGTYANNITFDLSNTHILGGATGLTIQTPLRIRGIINSSFSINQIYFWNGPAECFTIGSNNAPVYNTSVYLKKGSGGISTNIVGSSITLTIDKTYCYYFDGWMSTTSFNSSSFSGVDGLTVNIGDIIHRGLSTSTTCLISGMYFRDATINFNGVFDCAGSSHTLNYLFSAYGNLKLNFNPNFKVYINNRVSQVTTYSRTVGVNVPITLQSNSKLIVPDVPTVPTLTYSGTVGIIGTGTVGNSMTVVEKLNPYLFTVEYANQNDTVLCGPPSGINNFNILVCFRNGDSPYEVLSPDNNVNAAILGITYYPKVTLDSSTFATVGPSLKALLSTYSASVWQGERPRAKKAIKMPCLAGTSYTVTGKVRTNHASFVNDDVRMIIGLRNTAITYQIMTTACINAWESFSLTFTAAQTAEYNLLWEMRFIAGGQSIWLDDVVIS